MKKSIVPFSSYAAILLCAFVLATALIWASLTEIEISVRGEGFVTAPGSNRRAQHLEGGVVTALYVHEGQKVHAGEVMVSVSPDIAGSEIGERRAKIEALQASVIRMKAEVEGGVPVFPPSTSITQEETFRHEEALFTANKMLLESKINALSRTAARSDAEARSKEAQLEGFHIQETVIVRNVNMHSAAIRGGAGLPGRLVEVETQLAAIRASILALPDSIEADRMAAEEARARINSEKAAAVQEAAAKLLQNMAEMQSLSQAVKSWEDRLRRVDVVSPIEGTVHKLNVFSIGEIVAPNATVAEIVPSDEGLVIEARIKPDQVRGIRPGLPALVRVSAYDVSRFGSLNGIVTDMSPDSAKDERTGQPYYKIKIKTEKSDIRGEPVIIGMQTDVSIITGKRTVLNYFTSPISGWTGSALREK